MAGTFLSVIGWEVIFWVLHDLTRPSGAQVNTPFWRRRERLNKLYYSESCPFYVENDYQADPLGNNWVPKTFCKLVLIY